MHTERLCTKLFIRHRLQAICKGCELNEDHTLLRHGIIHLSTIFITVKVPGHSVICLVDTTALYSGR